MLPLGFCFLPVEMVEITQESTLLLKEQYNNLLTYSCFSVYWLQSQLIYWHQLMNGINVSFINKYKQMTDMYCIYVHENNSIVEMYRNAWYWLYCIILIILHYIILHYIISSQIWESIWKILALVSIPATLAAAVGASGDWSPADEAHQ